MRDSTVMIENWHEYIRQRKKKITHKPLLANILRDTMYLFPAAGFLIRYASKSLSNIE